MYNRGEIWLANLNAGKGTEPGKVRPVLIIQCQDLLDVDHPSTLIIPPHYKSYRRCRIAPPALSNRRKAQKGL